MFTFHGPILSKIQEFLWPVQTGFGLLVPSSQLSFSLLRSWRRTFLRLGRFFFGWLWCHLVSFVVLYESNHFIYPYFKWFLRVSSWSRAFRSYELATFTKFKLLAICFYVIWYIHLWSILVHLFLNIPIILVIIFRVHALRLKPNRIFQRFDLLIHAFHPFIMSFFRYSFFNIFF